MDTANKDYPRISAIRRDLESVNEKLSIVDAKVDALNQGLYPVPDRIVEMNSDMSMRNQKLADLEQRNKIHSAKLKLLQKELTYVKTENDLLKEQFTPRGGIPGRDGMAQNYDDGQRGAGSRMADANKPVNVYPDAPQYNQQQYADDEPQQRNGQDSHRAASNQGQLEDLKYNHDTNANDRAKQEYDYEEIQRERRRKIYGMHDATAIKPHRWEEKPKHRKYPWYDHKTHPYPGGFLFLRFDDGGFNIADNALKKQQSICRHTGGYLMGMARKDRIFIYESAPSKQMNWNFSKVQQFRDVSTTENAMAVFWFTSRDAAESFFGNTHKNPFREPCFPTANGYEAFYVPLCNPPTKTLNTFLFVEFLNAHKYDAENVTSFEAEVRRDMSRVCPGCDPMDVSSQTGRVVFKPGLLISPHSKLFISRFESQRDTDQIWKLGMIQALRQKYGLTGEMNVYSLSIDVAM